MTSQPSIDKNLQKTKISELNYFQSFTLQSLNFMFRLIFILSSIIYSIIDWFHYHLVGPRECYVEEILKRNGFQFKVHRNVTKDGVLIYSFQIFPKIKNENRKKPIFLQHSFMINCIPFLFYENSLSMRFLKLGHEVWLGNTRFVFGLKN
jgi:hypothetical protein